MGKLAQTLGRPSLLSIRKLALNLITSWIPSFEESQKKAVNYMDVFCTHSRKQTPRNNIFFHWPQGSEQAENTSLLESSWSVPGLLRWLRGSPLKSIPQSHIHFNSVNQLTSDTKNLQRLDSEFTLLSQVPGVQLETSGPCVDSEVTGLGELKHVETVETLYVKTERKHLMPLVETLDTQHMRPLI